MYVRENFCSWSDEDEPDKIQALLDMAQHDMEYILNRCAYAVLVPASRVLTGLERWKRVSLPT